MELLVGERQKRRDEHRRPTPSHTRLRGRRRLVLVTTVLLVSRVQAGTQPMQMQQLLQNRGRRARRRRRHVVARRHALLCRHSDILCEAVICDERVQEELAVTQLLMLSAERLHTRREPRGLHRVLVADLHEVRKLRPGGSARGANSAGQLDAPRHRRRV